MLHLSFHIFHPILFMDYNFLGKTILIVEDEKVNQFFFEKALKKTQANLFFVQDGKEAIEMVTENSEIDVVLMDIRMPRMDGIEATRKIKNINPELPVIIQTANSRTSVLDDAEKSGCNDLITKPIKIETLLSILKKHLIY